MMKLILLMTLSFSAACLGQKTDTLIQEPVPGLTQEIDSDIIKSPDTQAKLIYAENGIQSYIANNIIYPPIAIELHDQGKVYLSFIVELDGTLSDIKIVRGASKALNAEALRLINASPKWTPATVEGKPVRSTYRLPIAFVFK